jgi:hypothetical protein
LACTTFQTLMAITAKFDLETKQMDVVDAFVNWPLDETVFWVMLGFTKVAVFVRSNRLPRDR